VTKSQDKTKQPIRSESPRQQQSNNLPEVAQLRTTQLTCFAKPKDFEMEVNSNPPPPAPGLWKKREITIQERIVEYTKIDEHGVPQNLIEREKHQHEVSYKSIIFTDSKYDNGLFLCRLFIWNQLQENLLIAK